MKNFEILYFNYVGQCDSTFYVKAKNTEDAIRIYRIMYPHNMIEDVCEYTEPRFLTEEEVRKIAKK